ncbi:unnamed protein product [Leptosia nina]|uniref:Uncharacterized protein n=1 Tax=Leptosia nina TaxID=320188 RepID=A0AAV1IZP9_9NEOP
MGLEQSLQPQEPSISDEPPFTVAEFEQFYDACGEYFFSMGSVKLTFLTGDELTVHYTFDPARAPGDKLLIYWGWLMPLFWGPPPGTKSWARLPAIVDLIEKKVHYGSCNVLATDTCSCRKNPHTVVAPGLECKNTSHLHHFCATHISAWLKNYAVPAILLKESKELFSEYIGKVHRNNPDILNYYATGDRTDTDILLESVRNITGEVSDPAISI